jgi:hypothetical protein
VDAEYCGAIDKGMNPEVDTWPDRRGGRVRTLCDTEGWKSDGKVSYDDARGTSRYSGGIGGGTKFEVNIPSPTERCGDGEWIVSGGGL